MPKINLQRKHFEFLRQLVKEFQDELPSDADPLVFDLTQEVLTLLNYARHFRRFTIEIESGDDGEKV